MDYETLRQCHVADLFESLAEHFERVHWSAERLSEERVSRLRDLVRTAVAGSSWHRDRLGGVDIDALDERTLEGLPVMTKDDLMDHFDQIVTDPRLNLRDVNAHVERLDTGDAYLLDEYHVIASGGSSGRRGVFVFGWDAWRTFQLSVIRQFPPDLPFSPMAAVSAHCASHATAALSSTFSGPDLCRLPVTLPISEIVDGLNSAQPAGLTGYPSALHELAHRAVGGELKIAPAWVAATSEPLTSEARQAIKDAWGAPVANCWGTSEAGIVAMGCFRSEGMHLSDDLVIIEPVDEHGRPVPVGVPSAKIYVTNLFNPVLPLIRYELTDQVVVLDEDCPCGSAHRRVADIQGRLDDRFDYPPGIKVHPHVFRSILSRQPNVIEYQVTQTPNGAKITVVASGDIGINELERAIESELRHAGLGTASVVVKPVERLKRISSGKVRRFVPLVSASAP